MNRLTAALAAATMLGIAGPVAAQSMQGMDHSAMPGMTMPMPAKKKPVVAVMAVVAVMTTMIKKVVLTSVLSNKRNMRV